MWNIHFFLWILWDLFSESDIINFFHWYPLNDDMLRVFSDSSWPTSICWLAVGKSRNNFGSASELLRRHPAKKTRICFFSCNCKLLYILYLDWWRLIRYIVVAEHILERDLGDVVFLLIGDIQAEGILKPLIVDLG